MCVEVGRGTGIARPSLRLGPDKEQVWGDIGELSFASPKAPGPGWQTYHIKMQDTQLNVNFRYTMNTLA